MTSLGSSVPTLTDMQEHARVALARKPLPLDLELLAQDVRWLCGRVEELEEALQEARGLAISVADKNIGPLSERARSVQGYANHVLRDVPSTKEIAGILARPAPEERR